MTISPRVQQAFVVAASVTFVAMGPFVADGVLDVKEWWAIAVTFGGTFFAFLKEHPSKDWDGMERRVTGSAAERRDVPPPNTAPVTEAKQ